MDFNFLHNWTSTYFFDLPLEDFQRRSMGMVEEKDTDEEVQHRWGDSRWGTKQRVRVRYFWKVSLKTELEHWKVNNPQESKTSLTSDPKKSNEEEMGSEIINPAYQMSATAQRGRSTEIRARIIWKPWQYCLQETFWGSELLQRHLSPVITSEIRWIVLSQLCINSN